MTAPLTPIPITSENKGRVQPSHPKRERRGHVGWIVTGSLITGLVLALVLAIAPLLPAEEGVITGAVLCGFAAGWALLAVLSARFTDQPQRWAAAPAIAMAVGGLLLIGFGESAREALSWVWPPAMLGLAIWVFVQARQQLRSPSRRWVLCPVMALLALGSLGGGYETVRERMDTSTYPIPGRLIEVSGHSLHLSCSGSGSPTVVLEPGAGATSSDMGWITPAVAAATRACVYDRAGRGWSEPGDTVQDGTQIARDLHSLLQQGGIAPPYVVAGHSFGGLYSLRFAALYPEDVAGMVLVDSTAPRLADNPAAASPPDAGANDVVSRLSILASISARLGLSGPLGTPQHLRSTIDEYANVSASTEQAASLENFADKPLVVLSAGSGSDAAWLAAHDDLVALSTNSVHRVIDGATHQMLIANEEGAAETTRAILDVVASVRSTKPLHP